MTEPAPPPPPPLPEPRAPEQAYGRTWELELLISGAVTFALLQLPSAIDHAYLWLDAVSVGTLETAVEFGYAYSKMMVYTLIGGFLLHLAFRAYWVGLIGLDATFPGGVRWEGLSYPRVKARVHRECQPSLGALSRRVDAFCSLIFSFAWVVVLSFAGSLFWVLLAMLAVVGAARIGFPREAAFLLVFGAPIGFLSLAWVAERLEGAGIARAPRLDGLVARIHRATFYLAPGVYPFYNVLLSNLPRRAVSGAVVLVSAGVMGVFMVRDILLPRDRLSAGAYAFLPDAPGPLGIDPRYYRSLREGAVPEAALPSIQAEVVSEPFVRLFLPYRPERHNVLVAARCPEVPRLQEAGVRDAPGAGAPTPPEVSGAVLSCLARLQPASLNGARLDGRRFRFAADPATGIRGVVAYLPTAEMRAGENLLVVGPLPPAEGEEPRAGPHYIPFWVGSALSGGAAPSRGW